MGANNYIEFSVQSGAATCSEGFVICFLKVHLACLCSMTAAVQPNCLWNPSENILLNHFQNLTPQNVCLSVCLPEVKEDEAEQEEAVASPSKWDAPIVRDRRPPGSQLWGPVGVPLGSADRRRTGLR